MAGSRKLIAGVVGALALAVLAVAMATPSAWAGGINEASVKVAKEKAGPYKGYRTLNVPDGATKELWFRIRSKGNTKTLDLSFGDDNSSDEEGYKVKFFKHGDNVTSEVTGAGYPFHLDPGDSKYFNAKVKADDPPGGMCLGGLLFDKVFNTEVATVGVNTECAF